MKRTSSLVLLLMLTAASSQGDLQSAEPAVDEVIFSRQVQPLLAKHCLECHGPDKSESGLRLDRSEFANAKLESGERAIVPGKPDASELLRRVASKDEIERMPPESNPLSKTEIEMLKKWIEQGARYEEHWAYRPISEPQLPAVKNESWVRDPIDRFVLSRLEETGIDPSPDADPATLMKRLHYDLIGLPPTPQEVDSFLQDRSPHAYEALVDRLLASPHFGERWGRHWLDKARYADSDGYEKDRPRPNAWRYRDWVIRAINDDMPFDRFTIEQLAGDLLPDPTPEQKLATAFHRQTLTNTEGGTDQEEFRIEATFDRTETTAAVWLGLTMTCARCHSHKYDQIKQEEYYELFAFFNNANEANTEIARNEEALKRYEREQKVYTQKLTAAQDSYNEAKQKLQPQIEAWTKEMTARLETVTPLDFHPLTLVEATADSKAELEAQENGSILVSGPSPDKDKYTLVFEAPALSLTGLKIETLAHDSLGGKGPGRTAHGNFVLSKVDVLASRTNDFPESTTVEFSSAEADFSQNGLPPQNALSDKDRTGWAISPQMGKDHEITLFTKEPVEVEDRTYLKIVLDQSYGGNHTIGCFRITAMSGFDPLRALPKAVADAIKTPVAKRTPEQLTAIADHVAASDPAAGELAKQLETVKSRAPKSPYMEVRVIVPAERETHILHRGDFLQPAEQVDSGALEIISSHHPLESRQKGQPADRLDLARWLIDPGHPLTPRVTVNQVWAHLFGRGIVPTLNDFGVRGEPPTHPELLDWLAYHYPREMGWSRKTLIKTIVMSSTYRQSSNLRPDLLEVDPTNRLFARENRLRAEGEVVRDLHLAASGLLSRKVGGPSVFPPLPPGVAELSYANNFKWNTSEGEDRYRRGMYTFFKRTAPHPNLISFDCPDSNTTRLQRDSSNTPLQALVTLNNDIFTEAAQAMARRVLSEAGRSDTERLTYALRLCIIRKPATMEVDRFQQLLNFAREYYRDHPEDAGKLTERHAAEGVERQENAAWAATARMMMNLDEFIVRD